MSGGRINECTLAATEMKPRPRFVIKWAVLMIFSSGRVLRHALQSVTAQPARRRKSGFGLLTNK
jgi:hypothetical protein